jgi:hypothetical protein
LKRRDFLIGSIAAASAACGAPKSVAQDIVTMSKLERVGAMVNFPGLKETRDWSQPAPPGEVDIMDVPDLLAHRYHIHNVEVQQFHFLSMEPSYYEQFLGRLKKANSRMVDMPLELDTSGYSGTISPCSSDPQIRAHAIELTKQWIDRAAMIECPSVMVNQGHTVAADPDSAIEGLKIVKEYGESKNVAVIMEERGRDIPIDTLVRVIKESGIYANPDMGNFGDEQATENGLRLMYPLAKTVSHVKYNPERFSLEIAVAISKEMGYRGVYSIEGDVPTILPYLMMYL